MNQNTELMQGGSIMELPVLEIKNVHKKISVPFRFGRSRLFHSKRKNCWFVGTKRMWKNHHPEIDIWSTAIR